MSVEPAPRADALIPDTLAPILCGALEWCRQRAGMVRGTDMRGACSSWAVRIEDSVTVSQVKLNGIQI